jgi:GntR family transcriptional repressor for pyruvate dehydrogenase complex
MVVGTCHSEGKEMEEQYKGGNRINLFKAIRSKRLSDEIYEQIKSLIFKGGLLPGDKLPSERELAEAFKVGRPCLREALNQLCIVGLIEARGKTGSYVRSLTEEVMGPLKTFIEDEMRNLIDFMEVRKILDFFCAKEAIKKGTEEDLKKIREALENGDNAEFHISIAEATHNLILYHVILNMHALLSSISFIKQRRHNNHELYTKQHEKIYQALMNKDVDAAENAISEHIDVFINEAKKQTQ